MTREEVIKLVYEDFNSDDMWNVVIVTKDVFGVIQRTRATFEERLDAEQWFSNKTKNIPYYGYCCDKVYWNRIKELLEV